MVVVSAPGKILWIGGYSVLEKGNISFVTGVDKRVYVKAEKANTVHIKTPQFGIDFKAVFDGSRLVLSRELNDAEKKGSSFVRCAVETCLRYFKHKGISVSGVSIETYNDPAFGTGDAKSGLGGSAAVTVACVAGLFELHGIGVEENRDFIHKMAQYIHFRVQGKVGSGFDVAAACFGGHAYSRYSPDLIKNIPEDAPIEEVASALEKKWDYMAQSVDLPENFLVSMADIVGESASTSAMVKQINAWKESDKNGYEKLMKELNNANLDAIKWLKELNKSQNKESLDNFKKAFEKGRELTKELGVKSGAAIETDEMTKIIKESEKNGAFVAKLPGAGGGDNISAFSLSQEDRKKVQTYWENCESKKMNVVDISVSNEGVRIEDKDLGKIVKSFQ